MIAGGSLGGTYKGPEVSVLFIHGDKDPVVSYSIGQATYGMVPWPKAFLTITNGDHNSYLFGTSAAAKAVSASILDFLRWTLYGDATAKSRVPGEAAINGSTTFETTL